MSKITTKINKNHINEFNTWFIIFIIIISIVIIYFVTSFWSNLSIISDELNMWYDYCFFYNLLKNNLIYFIWVFFAYIIFLWYVKEKKWLIFLDDGGKTINSKYWNLFLLLYFLLNFVLLFYLVYLYRNWKIYELTILALTSYILPPISWFFLQKYLLINKDYESLKKINELKLVENNKLNRKIEKWERDDNANIIIVLFGLLNYLINSSITLSFLSIPLGLIFSFNLITILYIHIVFIYVYIVLNVISNKFYAKVDIKFDWELKENVFLTENSKDKVIIMDKDYNYILKPDKVDFIRVKRKK